MKGGPSSMSVTISQPAGLSLQDPRLHCLALRFPVCWKSDDDVEDWTYMTLNGVRALVFDVFGTVVDWRSGVAREAAPFLTRYGRDENDPARFADAWRRRYPMFGVVDPFAGVTRAGSWLIFRGFLSDPPRSFLKTVVTTSA